jgi:hypothetical protein
MQQPYDSWTVLDTVLDVANQAATSRVPQHNKGVSIRKPPNPPLAITVTNKTV